MPAKGSNANKEGGESTGIDCTWDDAVAARMNNTSTFVVATLCYQALSVCSATGNAYHAKCEAVSCEININQCITHAQHLRPSSNGILSNIVSKATYSQ